MVSRADQKAQTRKQIIKVAYELFLTEGFDEATTRKIAQKAKIAPGTIFVHFPDKASLLSAVLHAELDEVLAEAYRTLPQGADPKEKIIHLVSKLFYNYAKHPDLSLHLIKNSFFKSRKMHENQNQEIMKFIRKIGEFIAQGQSQNLIRQDLDLEVAAFNIWSNYLFALLVALQNNFQEIEKGISFFEHLISITFQGLRQ